MSGRSNWGRWGAEDETGALNLVGPEQVARAAASVRTGRVYRLGLPIGRASLPPVHNRPAPERYTLSAPADASEMEMFGAAPGVGANEDVIVIPSHMGTHMDALCHVFADDTIYNGHPAGAFTPRTGASRCSIERTAAFAARVVVLDVERHTGGLAPGQPIDGDLLEAVRAAAGVEMFPGDAVLVRTGWAERFLAGERGSYAQAGLGLGSVDFLADHDVAVVGVDNTAVECIPFDEGIFLGVHIELLRNLGVTLLEHLHLGELSADGVAEGMLVVAGLPVTGAAGSPINPIVIA